VFDQTFLRILVATLGPRDHAPEHAWYKIPGVPGISTLCFWDYNSNSHNIIEVSTVPFEVIRLIMRTPASVRKHVNMKIRVAKNNHQYLTAERGILFPSPRGRAGVLKMLSPPEPLLRSTVFFVQFIL
jgi:hypothetical protein